MRGNMRGRGGFAGAASRNLANNRADLLVHKPNAIRRLQKDLKELQASECPLSGVSAAPLEDSMYKWHGNLKGPANTIYKGGVWHFEMTFPENYPTSPPTIRLLT